MIFIIFLTGCNFFNKDLRSSIITFLNDNCDCYNMVCECHDTYSQNNTVYVDCNGVDVNSMSDILIKCNYYNVVDGYKWEKNGEGINCD